MGVRGMASELRGTAPVLKLTLIIEIGSTLARFPLRWAPKYTAFNCKTFSYFIVVIHLDDVFVASIAM